MKSARRQAREVALQALYACQLSGHDPLAQARTLEGYDKTDARFVETLLRGVLGRAILYIGTYELALHPETPFKVVLNEAVELGKSFGATDGYRFVNGVLERIAATLRPEEVVSSRTNV